MAKTDIKKERKDLYAPSSTDFALVDVPELTYLMIDGDGDPNTAASYREAVEALYAVSYALKFASKKHLDRDYVVGPLEGLWSAADPSSFVRRAKDEWQWTMMIVQPEWITGEMVAKATATTAAKKDVPAIPILRHERYHEGCSVQILHIGSYDDETSVLARLHDEFMPARGLTFNGPHHEIYLSDPRRTAPDRLRTVLRQPVRARDAGERACQRSHLRHIDR